MPVRQLADDPASSKFLWILNQVKNDTRKTEMKETTISIKNTTKGMLPRLPFLVIKEIKNTILGKKYELSIAFVTPAVSKRANTLYRKKNEPTDILSFSLEKNSGELMICLPRARAKAREFGMSYQNYLGFMFIHGMLHLKGYDHSSTMDKLEKKWCKRFNFTHPFL